MAVKEKDINAEIKALMPIVQREAMKMARTMPASVTVDDLKAAGMEGAWQAVRDFDGGGSLKAFAVKRIFQRMVDYSRTEHPAGRSGKKITGSAGDGELDRIASDDDQAAQVELAQAYEVAMTAMKPRNREAVERVIACQPRKEVAAAMGVSVSRVHQYLGEAVNTKQRQRTPDTFDPASVPLHMGKPVPPRLTKTRNKFKELADATPATGSRVLGNVQARSFIAQLKKMKIRHVFRQVSATTIEVWREPSAEQLKGLKDD